MLIAIATYFESLDYMLYLKVISVIAELVCACFGGICAYRLLKDKKEGKLYAVVAFAIIWLSPTTIMNGAFWGQCDYIYTAFIFVSIWAMLREKYRLAFVFLGIAFAFKLQAALQSGMYIHVFSLCIFFLQWDFQSCFKCGNGRRSKHFFQLHWGYAL